MSLNTQGDRTNARNFNRSSQLRRQSTVEIDIEDPVLDIDSYNRDGYEEHLIHSSDRVAPSSLRRTSSTSSPNLSIRNDEDLRMSEERLLAELKDQHDQDQDSHEDEHDEEEEATDFVPVQPPPLLNNFAKPPNSRPSLLHYYGNSNNFTRTNSAASTAWMPHDHDEFLKHECDEKCSSLLHIAAKTGNVDEMEILLETGAEPNRRDCMRRTPLHWSVCTGKCPILHFYRKTCLNLLCSFGFKDAVATRVQQTLQNVLNFWLILLKRTLTFKTTMAKLHYI